MQFSQLEVATQVRRRPEVARYLVIGGSDKQPHLSRADLLATPFHPRPYCQPTTLSSGARS